MKRLTAPTALKDPYAIYSYLEHGGYADSYYANYK